MSQLMNWKLINIYAAKIRIKWLMAGSSGRILYIYKWRRYVFGFHDNELWNIYNLPHSESRPWLQTQSDEIAKACSREATLFHRCNCTQRLSEAPLFLSLESFINKRGVALHFLVLYLRSREWRPGSDSVSLCNHKEVARRLERYPTGCFGNTNRT